MGHGLIFKLFILLIILPFMLMAGGSLELIKEEVRPYLLPENHPIKGTLDQFFAKSRWTFNLESLEKAGFIKPKPRKFTKLIVAKHPKFQGYVFKMYVDVQRYYKGRRDDEQWVHRIQGAELLRQAIAKLGLNDVFKVPCKWIYELPKQKGCPKGYLEKYYILIEEDMGLVSDQENKRIWCHESLTKHLLDQFYFLLNEVGLSDCAKPDNAAFCLDGKIAFIDTELFHQSVNYYKLNHYLSKSNKIYWEKLTSQN